jgi:hypothetical protein
MDPGSILIILAIFMLTALFLSRPFWDDTIEVTRENDDKLSHLLAERERLLTAIEELDFDHQLGKVNENAYRYRRRRLLESGGGVLKELEKYSSKGQTTPQKQQPPSPGEEEDDLEKLIASRRQKILESEHRFCSQCGFAVREGDKYCGNCGADLTQ